MPSLLDVLFVAALVFLAVLGYRRGLVRSLAGIGRLILSVILTGILSTPVARLLETRVIHPPVEGYVGEKLATIAARTEGGVAEFYAAIPAWLRAHLTVGDAAVASLDAAVARWTETVSRAVSGAISSLLATVLVFIVAFLTLPALLRLLSRVVRAIPLLSGIDRLLGLALGILTGFAAVALASRVIAALLIASGRPDWVEASCILQLLGIA